MAKTIRIVEVGARDGLQNEEKLLSVATRAKFITSLKSAGLPSIEAGSFVSPEWVPQMSGTDQVLKKIFKGLTASQRKTYSVLVPNKKGMELAVENGVKEVAVFAACSEGFSKKNINCSIRESFNRFTEVFRIAKSKNIKVRGYLSTAFGCPYDGAVKVSVVKKLTLKMLDLGAYDVSIGDTIGVAVPSDVQKMMKAFSKDVPLNKISMHFHDTRGTALANVFASLQYGISSFDSSLGGLGGCPYAKGASGNLATEDLVYMLQKMGYKTVIDLQALVVLKKWIEKQVERQLPGHIR